MKQSKTMAMNIVDQIQRDSDSDRNDLVQALLDILPQMAFFRDLENELETLQKILKTYNELDANLDPDVLSSVSQSKINEWRSIKLSQEENLKYFRRKYNGQLISKADNIGLYINNVFAAYSEYPPQSAQYDMAIINDKKSLCSTQDVFFHTIAPNMASICFMCTDQILSVIYICCRDHNFCKGCFGIMAQQRNIMKHRILLAKKLNDNQPSPMAIPSPSPSPMAVSYDDDEDGTSSDDDGSVTEASRNRIFADDASINRIFSDDLHSASDTEASRNRIFMDEIV